LFSFFVVLVCVQLNYFFLLVGAALPTMEQGRQLAQQRGLLAFLLGRLHLFGLAVLGFVC